MRSAPLLAMMLAASPALADDPPKPSPAPVPKSSPVAALAADRPGPYLVGQLVALDASATVGDTVMWDTETPDDFYREDTGHRRVIFAATAPGSYSFKVMAFSLINGNLESSKAKLSLVVQPPTPVVPPVPVGPVSPPAPTPGDPLGLTATTRALLKSMTWSNESLTWRQNTLAPIFAGVASNAAAYPGGQAMIADLEAKYRVAIGSVLWPQWDAALFVPLRAQLVALTAAKKIATVADLAEAFTEIANALKGD